jgi:hypothetical protein
VITPQVPLKPPSAYVFVLSCSAEGIASRAAQEAAARRCEHDDHGGEGDQPSGFEVFWTTSSASTTSAVADGAGISVIGVGRVRMLDQ